MARKTKEVHANVIHFTRTLKSKYQIKSGDTKKWKPLAECFRPNLIYILEYILYT